jgi:hypothetical protein
MQQLTLPYRIALVGLLVVVGLWFTVLKPSGGGTAAPAAAPTAPGVTGLTNDVAKAKGAVDASNAAAARSESAANAVGATGGTSAHGSTGAAKTAAAKKKAKSGLAADAIAGDPSRKLLSAVDAGKVVVLLFWNRQGSDDRAALAALRAVDTHGGKVVTRAVPIRDVGKYEAITLGAKILASPTVLVIGAKGKATAINGFTQVREIDQTVADVGGSGF